MRKQELSWWMTFYSVTKGSIGLEGRNSFLKIDLGNVDGESIEDMSGAWKIDIKIPEDAQHVVVMFDYRIILPEATDDEDVVKMIKWLKMNWLKFWIY